MSSFKLMKLEKVALRNHPVLKESWVQELIAADPKILGLGDVVLKDKERIQPRAGRLDLLLQDTETNRRYEVEVQLGETDESHIIRTIEYWDIERKRYPQYDHCAVIVAEHITARFLNVISLFNGTIPLIAIQMSALVRGDEVALMFTTVLDELTRGLVDDDEIIQPNTDRAYWEQRTSPEMVALADRVVASMKSFARSVVPSFKKHYMGIILDGQANNFVLFEPKKNHLIVSLRIEQSEEIRQQLENSGLDMLNYDKYWGRYRFRMNAADFDAHQDDILALLKKAHENA